MLLAPLAGYAMLAVATGTAWFTKQSAATRWTLTAITVVLFSATFMGWGTGMESPGSSGTTPGIPEPRS
ncbi:hypothetical protein [Streptomyces sp. CNQ085]|uniref:hypothetical protein n=1 Tax=Streptomyces sp. CNQ085 TaxID=2886944 RepID=UPI001F50EB9A|nr:hypothetical protein [Streptomyces sp. CNQ085]MCI0386120.1 hypothetical protein [Streptomyces sp. CNQ085]